MRTESIGAAEVIYPVFDRMNWKYWDGKPSKERIAETIDHLFDNLDKEGYEKDYETETGRIVVEYDSELNSVSVLLRVYQS